jgi:AcrR family transcriptional regulator
MTSQERREAIIDAAIKLFADKGFRGTTTRELAAAVRVSEPVLYQHFQTKRELYAAIIQRKAQASEQRMKEKLGPFFEAADDAAFFAKLAEMIIDWYEEDPAYIRILLFSALEGHELSDLFHECQCNSFLDRVTEYIRRRIEAGAFREVNPGAVAGAFAGMVAHYSQCRAITPNVVEAYPKEDVIPVFVQIFLNGIRKEAAAAAGLSSKV